MSNPEFFNRSPMFRKLFLVFTSLIGSEFMQTILIDYYDVLCSTVKQIIPDSLTKTIQVAQFFPKINRSATASGL